MKQIILSFLVTIMVAGLATAQEIRLNAFSKYVFDDKVDSYNSSTSFFEGKIEGGFQWGLGLEYMAHPTKGIELKYLRQEAQVPMKYYLNGINTKTFDVDINYVLIGGNNYFKTGGKVEPYGGLGLGMVIFKIQNPESSSTDDSAIKFAWELKLGTNIWVSEKVGIKLQADLASAVQSAGGGLYFGTGGAGAGVSTYSTMYQIGLGGGLTFKLK